MNAASFKMLDVGAPFQQGAFARKPITWADFGAAVFLPLVWLSHLRQRREAGWAKLGRGKVCCMFGKHV